jgi:hypothetical protein
MGREAWTALSLRAAFGQPIEEDNGIHVLNELSGWRQRRSEARELTGAGGNAGSLVRLCQFSEILSEI